MILVPIISALLQIFSVVHKKTFLRTSRIPYTKFIANLTFLLAIVSIFLLPIDYRIDAGAFAPVSIGLMAVLIIATLADFWLWHIVMRHENLSKFDLLILFEPLGVLLLAGVFLPAERDPRLWIVAVVALAALAFGHFKGRKVKFDNFEILMLPAILSIGLKAVSAKILLDFYSPISLYSVRTIIVGFVFAILLGVHWQWEFKKEQRNMFLIALVSLVFILFSFWSYDLFGVTITTLVSLIYPIGVYFLARRYFNEQQPFQMTIAGLIIVGLITYTLLFLTDAPLVIDSGIN